jgi:hypothetical protein
MSGLTLVTRGFISPDHPIGDNSGGAGWSRRDETQSKPVIQVSDVTIKGENKKPITKDMFKVKSLKIIVEQKD